MKIFFGGHSFMEESLGEFGKNFSQSHPQKVACSCTYVMCCTTTDLGIF